MNPNDYKPQHEDVDEPELDVQVHPTGASITVPEHMIDENLPGQINLNMEEVGQLRDLVNEAWFIGWGLQPMSIAAAQVEPGDIIPCLGLTIKKNVVTDGGSVASLRFSPNYTEEKLNLPAGLEITVHRRIQ